ncbi:MAG TPA: hypothetical protein VGK73_06625 [Polyangiaceae bacterium]
MKRVDSRGSRSARRRSLWTLASACALSCAALSPPARASDPAVVVGEVSAAPKARALLPELRRALVAEVERAPVVRTRERFVLSASLVQLETEQGAAAVRATAVVSLVLRHAREQRLRAILSGRATAEESGSDLESARESALHAAVESAVRRLPEALR